MNNKIESLLKRFHSDEISQEELRDLTNMFNHVGQEEIHAAMNNHWENYENYSSLPQDKINTLYQKIRLKKEKALTAKTKRYWLRIAASLLFLLASSISLLFYKQHLGIQEIAKQNIMINSGEYSISSVLLPDGSKVKLNSNSSLSYQNDFGYTTRKVKLSGEGYFEVKRNEKKQFTVQTSFMDITVLGTTFNVYAYEDKDFQEMALVAGSVCVSTNHPPYKTLKVRPNEKVIYNKQTKELKLESIKDRFATVWIEKNLVFRHDKLKEVFKCLERKFAVTFTIDDQSILNDSYTGFFDEENIENILRTLQIHYGFEYEIQKNNIHISMK